jgi:hypothetical protein
VNAHTAGLPDAHQVDTDGYHSTVTNTSRLTIPVAGYYRLVGNATFNEVASGFRFACIWKNGVGTGTRLASGERAARQWLATPQTARSGVEGQVRAADQTRRPCRM